MDDDIVQSLLRDREAKACSASSVVDYWFYIYSTKRRCKYGKRFSWDEIWKMACG